MRSIWALAISLLVAGCNDDEPCLSAADCDPAQQCLLDDERGEGRCLAAPGLEVEPPPLRVFPQLSHTVVLLVVDDGPGTAPIQARLVASLGAMVEQARASHDDLRVAVTTTSVDDAVCEPVAAASHGQLAATSCLDRLHDFVGADGTDARSLCTDHCPYTTQQLGPLSGPWIDVWDLPSDIDPAAALACLVPQGISGCEYAAPAEATRRAFLLSTMESSAGFGLFRDQTEGTVVVVTDGVDCSRTASGGAAFDPLGSRALWSDPGAAEATAAVCWNAGVSCSGDPLAFDDCTPIDRDLDGERVADDVDPVLRAFSSYDTLFSDGWLPLHVIAGVPTGDPREPTYSAAGDPAWLLEHGIDPGCSDGPITALPPVRLRDLADGLSSVCEADYAAPLESLLEGDVSSCLRTCGDPLTVEYESPTHSPQAIPECVGPYPRVSVPPGAPACYLVREDSERCSSPGRVDLVLLPADPGQNGAFLLSPNPWRATTSEEGCEG